MTVGNQFVLGEDLPASMQEWKEGMEQYKNKICSGPSGTIYKVSPSADTLKNKKEPWLWPRARLPCCMLKDLPKCIPPVDPGCTGLSTTRSS